MPPAPTLPYTGTSRPDQYRSPSSTTPPLGRPLLLFDTQARLGLTDRSPEAVLAEARATYARLMVLDPLRRGYYQDALDGKAFVVVQALGSV